MTKSNSRTRQIVLAVFGIVASASIAVTLFAGPLAAVFSQKKAEESQLTAPTTTAAPALTIKPLPVRPVVSAFVTTPDQCPPPPAPAPAQPIRICDITKTAVYELAPEALALQLTKVESYRNPLTDTQVVQMSMTNESAQDFARFTSDRIGQQVAFVRGGTVVWGPKITTPIEGQVLQLSGELTPEQATEVANMLRDGP